MTPDPSGADDKISTRTLRYLVLIVCAIYIVASTISIWLQVRTPPISHFIPVDTESVALCRGDTLSISREIQVVRAPSILDVVVTIWDKQNLVSIHRPLWSQRAIYSEKTVHPVRFSIDTEGIPAGEYQLRFATTSSGYAPSFSQMNFSILNCESAP